MRRQAPVQHIDDNALEVHDPKAAAAGIKAVTVAVDRGVSQAGVARTVRSMLRVNQRATKLRAGA
ncbi:hypothetical protein ACFQ36_10960 [Arthrobacter sp. GCM10027362]|uniref:hypothetical protein n=1 Tax=Arthrobacter sp. GCM10027362 TaxID=3273379 RepID=UPI00363D5E54